MQLAIYTDGGSRGNPGPSAYGFVVYQNRRLIFSQSAPIGKATNNLAEYTGLIKALEWVKKFLITNYELSIASLFVFSDSSLMVNQLNGLFKVKNPVIREMIIKIRIFEAEIKIPIVYKHIPREKNQAADHLVKKALSLSSWFTVYTKL